MPHVNNQESWQIKTIESLQSKRIRIVGANISDPLRRPSSPCKLKIEPSPFKRAGPPHIRLVVHPFAPAKMDESLTKMANKSYG